MGNYDLKGKRLLILGGNSATLDLVRNAKEMGIYTVVTDYLTGGVAKDEADEIAPVSTCDFDGLKNLIKEKKIDGVFCGPSEFNIRNMIKLCEMTGLPCYSDSDVWERCANKDVFKETCRKYGVDCIPEYDIDELATDEELEKIDYPIMIKPVDSHSSRGVKVCNNRAEVRVAIKEALEHYQCKRIIAEKFIENNGEIFSTRYLIRDGKAVQYLCMDTCITNPETRKNFNSSFAFSPSKYAKYYMENMNDKVIKMIEGMGLKNGTAFFQCLPYKGKIYFMEMGYRLSGGMIFKLTEPMFGINDMKMMIRLALGGKMYEDEEVKDIDVLNPKKNAAQLVIPLDPGTIGKIEGLGETKKIKCVTDFIQYYDIGGVVEKKFVGTLSQHFGRFTMIAPSGDEIYEAVRQINKTLKVYNTEGEIMNTLKFDLKRIEHREI